MGMFFTCPDDPTHQSTTPDICSVCGALMACAVTPSVPAGSGPFAAPAASRSGLSCPSCGVPRRPEMAFCENCGLDFATGQLDVPDAPAVVAPTKGPTAELGGPAPVGDPTSAFAGSAALDLVPAAASALAGSVALDPVTTSASAPAAPSPSGSVPAARLQAVVSIDLGVRERPDDAVPPPDQRQRVYLLDSDRLLIGRGSSTVHPHIVLSGDSGVSRGHAELLRQSDGGYMVRDLGSANGTLVNGQPLVDQELKPVTVGDQVAIGFWHLLTVKEC